MNCAVLIMVLYAIKWQHGYLPLVMKETYVSLILSQCCRPTSASVTLRGGCFVRQDNAMATAGTGQ